jgi:hypothetical protein
MENYGESIDYDDATICKHISKITIRHGDMVYLPEIMLDESAKQDLLSYVRRMFEEGKNVIYYEALYKEFSDAFKNGIINNIDMLKTYLCYINDGSMYLSGKYISSDENIKADAYGEVRQFMISVNNIISLDDIENELPHLTRDKIKYVLKSGDEFILNRKGSEEYFHADIIDLSQSELDLIADSIRFSINSKDYINENELKEIIENKVPSVMEHYHFLTTSGLRKAFAYKLRDEFSFKGKIISPYGKDLSMDDVFANFAKRHKHFTITQLTELKKDLDTQIYFNAVYKNSLRINKDEFVSIEQAKFDVDAIDYAIDYFCSSDFIAIKDISIFGGFPDAYFPWNSFLLEHYVAMYSKKYKLIHTAFNTRNPVGAIVKRSSNIDNFDDVIIRVLADGNVSLNTDDALQYLCDTGFLDCRKYSNIDSVLTKANILRKKQGE